MRHKLQARRSENANRVKFYIGDVRNSRSISDAMPCVNYILHAAALKQVSSYEFFPIKAVKTNVLGAENVLTAAIEEEVKSVCDYLQAAHWTSHDICPRRAACSGHPYVYFDRQLDKRVTSCYYNT